MNPCLPNLAPAIVLAGILIQAPASGAGQSESTRPLTLHIATNGNDGWSGGLASPNRDRSDGPLGSLAGARDAIRKARAGSAQRVVPATVIVHGGTYRLDAPLMLEPQDSGTAEAPVRYTAAKGERPVISGGRVLAGFRQNGRLWECGIPEAKTGAWYFNQLFVDGHRRQRARSPNTGYHRIARLIPGPPIPNAKPVARDQFGFSAGDIQPWTRLGDATVTLMHSWETSIHSIASVDTVSNVVHFTAPMKEWWSIGYWEDSQRYFVENAFELLDQPGEWYLNRETGVLSYWPLPGEKLGRVEIVAPRLTELVRFAGNADQGHWVEHVTLRGLTFHHADWLLDPKGNSSTQAAVETPAVIMADGARHCAVEQCEIAHIGTYGVWFRRGSKDNRIVQNRLFDLGAGGVRIGEANRAATDEAESSQNLVDNNHIFDGGHVFPAGIGIWVAQSSHNRISHNDVHDLKYSGLSIGWNWDDAPNRTHDNLIEFNHVHDLVHGVLSDAGLIYCLGASPGSVIRNNVFHDIWPYATPQFGWGIYLDATCSGYRVESNLVYNTRSGGLMYNNGGHEHVIRNNVFALSTDFALWPYWEKRPNTFERNIVLLTQGALFIPHAENSLKQRLEARESLGTWDSNLYWQAGGAESLRFFRRGFQEWQALGLDTRSRSANPRFRDLRRGDFGLRPDSPALQLGFKPIDIRNVGLYGDRVWANEARHADCRLKPLPAPPPAPKPLALDDGFEAVAAGSLPALAQVSGEGNGASIRVSAERAAQGRQSLKITDSATLQPSWQPHFYYQPRFTNGLVRQSFDVWLESNSLFFTEWRDESGYPQNVGPSIAFTGDGTVRVAGKVVGTIPPGHWAHVEVEAAIGMGAARTFSLRISVPGQGERVVRNLPFAGAEFRELHWLGFSSTAAADTTFHLDNLKIHQSGR